MLERQRRASEEETERRLAQLREAHSAQPADLAGAELTAVRPLTLLNRKGESGLPWRRSPAITFSANRWKSRTTRLRRLMMRHKSFSRQRPRFPRRATAWRETGCAASAEGVGTAIAAAGRKLFRLYEGTLVRATLANRLEGSFTGPVNCLVSADLRSQGGAEILIPKNSRLIGKANRVEAGDQTRLAVTFSRLLMPNGYSVTLDAAPGLDTAGETGLSGKVNNHTLRKFGMAGAVGLLGGLALLGGQANPYAAGVANSTGNSATTILNHYLNALPTITVPEGHPVNIYLPEDLLVPAYRSPSGKDQQ